MLKQDTKDFWKAIKSTNHSSIKVQAATINGTTGKHDICDVWKAHYEELLNSARDTTKEADVMSALEDIESDDQFRITPDDMNNAIKQLKAGKSAGLDGLMSEHLTNAAPQLNVLLSLVFNGMLTWLMVIYQAN